MRFSNIPNMVGEFKTKNNCGHNQVKYIRETHQKQAKVRFQAA